MATKSTAKRVLEQSLQKLGPAQLSMLPGSPETVHYTGKAGRPKGRKNNSTLLTEAGLEHMGDQLVRERVRIGLCDPVDEAIKRVRDIRGLPESVDPRVHHREEVAELAQHFDHLKAKEANNGLPFVRKKMPQEVDLTLSVPEARFVGFDAAVKAVAGDGARNVTPLVIDNDDRLAVDPAEKKP